MGSLAHGGGSYLRARFGLLCVLLSADEREHRLYADVIEAVARMVEGLPPARRFALLTGCEVGRSIAGSTVAASATAPRGQRRDRGAARRESVAGAPVTGGLRIAAAFVLALAAGSPAAGQEFYRVERAIPANSEDCYVTFIDISQRTPASVRVSIVARTGVPLAVIVNGTGDRWAETFGRSSGRRGVLSVDVERTEARELAVCVGATAQQARRIPYVVTAHWLRPGARMPHAGDGRRYDDELHRHLIFDGFDGRENASLVLPWPDPQFYIRLGGPEGCRPRRVAPEVLHYWRAAVPILAEQMTGFPYRHRVEAGCAPRAPEAGSVLVEYVTRAEYAADTGREWGEASAKARVGATWGRIWIRWFSATERATVSVQKLIAHEIGHAFGLHHTDRRGAVMAPGYQSRETFVVFTPDEEATARRAYRAGRRASYCGNPDRCGSGFAPGARPGLRGAARVVVD